VGVLYRVRQFTLALGAQANRERAEDLTQHLDPRQLDLFQQMSSVDQHHCLAVAGSLREAGYTDASVLRAGLLHDVGKTLGPVRIWHRVLAVLVKALFPSMWDKLDGETGTWLYPLHVHRHHAALGAELAAQAGCTPEVVWLITHHEDQRGEGQAADRKNNLLAGLQAADQIN
jgi:putative nucleotidyltransferase with HDIG domain